MKRRTKNKNNARKKPQKAKEIKNRVRSKVREKSNISTQAMDTKLLCKELSNCYFQFTELLTDGAQNFTIIFSKNLQIHPVFSLKFFANFETQRMIENDEKNKKVEKVIKNCLNETSDWCKFQEEKEYF